jgi:nucleoside-diphosphate-sugar epimerase
MKLSVIGAGGFVGAHVCRLAVQDAGITEIVLNDVTDLPDLPSQKVTNINGSFAEPDIRAAVCDADAVILLASILGGAAEADYTLARRINVDAVLDLFEHLRDTRPGTRVVLASSIAVFGEISKPVTDMTEPDPIMTYGAQKLMTEIALTNFTRKGWLDGISLRLSGVMARDGSDAALKTAFMSRLFWSVARGKDITLPVSPDAQTWMTSVTAAAGNFLHAATLPDLGPRRALTLPATCLTFGDLVQALHRAYPQSQSKIGFDPDPEIMRLFGRFPTLETPAAEALGFTKDRDIDALVADAIT